MDYGSTEHRQARYEELQEWFESKIKTIDAISDNYFKTICYFSLMECFAQEYGNYPKNNTAQNFCNFVLEFQTSYTFLDKIDPVSLFYHFKPELSESFDLSFVNSSGVYTPENAIESGKAGEMIEKLEALGTKQNKINKHKYVRLLYCLRSKLSHELSSPSSVMRFNHHILDKHPFYMSCGRLFSDDEATIDDEVWELTMPVGFIKNLVIECVNEYLCYSLKEKNDPFENYQSKRKSYLAWYD